MIETVSDVENSFLSRREITCNFQGLGGKLKRKEAIEMITKELAFSQAVDSVLNSLGMPDFSSVGYVYNGKFKSSKLIKETLLFNDVNVV